MENIRGVSRRSYIVVLLALVGVLAFSGTAFAGTATSATKSFSNGGKSYSATSTISTKSGTDRATTRLASKSGSVGAGHLGVNARAYRDDSGALVSSSGWTFNGVSAVAITVGTNFTGSASRAYYSKGNLRVYNAQSGAYLWISSHGSPSQNG